MSPTRGFLLVRASIERAYQRDQVVIAFLLASSEWLGHWSASTELVAQLCANTNRPHAQAPQPPGLPVSCVSPLPNYAPSEQLRVCSTPPNSPPA